MFGDKLSLSTLVPQQVRINPPPSRSFQALAFELNYGYIVYIMEWEWDDSKNEANTKKHGVCFEEALQVFTDSRAVEKEDRAH